MAYKLVITKEAHKDIDDIVYNIEIENAMLKKAMAIFSRDVK
ncbi:hypothetical protein [Desulfitibacter alkalitolerans]|nr:hypothetical protein [Desulfitibacter alkalitolerans]